MTQTIKHIRQLLLTATLLCLAWTSTATAEGLPCQLNAIDSQVEPLVTRVVLDMNKTPEFELQTSGQRINLVLHDTEAGTGLVRFPEDETIVKVLLAKDRQNLVVSLLLRRIPASVTVREEPKLAQLVIHILWDKPDQARPAIAFDLPDMPLRRSDNGATARLPVSKPPYQGNWLEFLKSYHTPVEIEVPLTFYLPASPLPSGETLKEDSQSLWRSAGEGQWTKVLQAYGQPASDSHAQPPEQTILMAQAALHLGKPGLALKFVDQAAKADSPQNLAAELDYLRAQALARQGKHYQALLVIGQRWSQLEGQESIRPLFALLQAEVHLALGQAAKAAKALEVEVKLQEGELPELWHLRGIDAASGSDQSAALQRYEDFLAQGGDLAAHPFSLASAASTALENRKFTLADSLFTTLIERIEPPAAKDMARYGALLARLLKGTDGMALEDLRKFAEASPIGEAGLRARLTVLDRDVLGFSLPETALQKVRDYTTIIASSKNFALREEASFKQALAYHFIQDDASCIEQLNRLQREFAHGQLINPSRALLIELLPGAIGQLLAAGDKIRALTLLEQNRSFLIRKPLQGEMLLNIAQAFADTGMLERACHVYLYLLDTPAENVFRQEAQLRLAELYLQQGNLSLAERQAARFSAQYPKAAGHFRALRVRVECRLRTEGPKAAAELLNQENLAGDSDFRLWAARIYWLAEEHERLEQILAQTQNDEKQLSPEWTLTRAENLLLLNRRKEAVSLFRILFSDPEFADQARFRAAEIEGRDSAEGQKLLQSLIAEGNDPRWRRLAELSLGLPENPLKN